MTAREKLAIEYPEKFDDLEPVLCLLPGFPILTTLFLFVLKTFALPLCVLIFGIIISSYYFSFFGNNIIVIVLPSSLGISPTSA